jgi:hypothetical protein
MAPSLVTIDASEPLDKIVETIEKDGGVIVANFLSSELLEELKAASKCRVDSRLQISRSLSVPSRALFCWPQDIRLQRNP